MADGAQIFNICIPYNSEKAKVKGLKFGVYINYEE